MEVSNQAKEVKGRRLLRVCLSCIALLFSFLITTHVCFATSNVAEGELYGCCKVSIDRTIAVGDRGLILLSVDGGKTWEANAKRSDDILHDVSFDDEMNGLVVGGKIEAYSGRSVGTVLITNNGGKSWNQPESFNLPRLIGLQRVGARHWIAWGDWSDLHQSSLFETIDGGKSWNARPVPIGHCRSAAVSPSTGMTVLLDRTGRSFVSPEGLEFRSTAIRPNSFHPLQFCKFGNGQFWIGGESGQLFQSIDGKVWQEIQLPGIGSDKKLFSLRDIAIVGDKIWVVGEPGNVVWHSLDAGKNWKVLTTNQSLPLKRINALNENNIVACGPFASIVASRNGGVAWWQEHLSGERCGLLSFATTHETIPWELLVHSTIESHRHASVVVLHDQHFDEATSNASELTTRIAQIGSALRLDQAVVLSQFPVGDMPSGIRSTDLAYYRAPASIGPIHPINRSIPSAPSEVTQHIVQKIRELRPDIVVVDDSTSKSSIESACSIACEQAIQLAANPSYSLYSRDSGIVQEPWQVQRVLYRSDKGPGLHLSRSMVLPASNKLLMDALIPVESQLDAASIHWLSFEDKNYYRMNASRSASFKNAFDGIGVDRATKLADAPKSSLRLPQLLSASQLLEKCKSLQSLRGPSLTMDSSYEDRMRELTKPLAPEHMVQALGWTAIDARRAGYWNRWNYALEYLLDHSTDEPLSEWCYHELMMHYGSAEVQRLVEWQLQNEKTAAGKKAQQDFVDTTTQSSPFAKKDDVVQRASFDRPAMATPIARGKSLDEFSRLLGRWPANWQVQRSDPQWAWMITSRSRSIQRGQSSQSGRSKMNQSRQAMSWPPYMPSVTTWTNVFEQEKTVLELDETADGLPMISRLQERPYLDGRDDEADWKSAVHMDLMPVWMTKSNGTSVRIARDDEFLYLFVQCPIGERSREVAQTASSPTRRHDSLNSNLDHVRLRVDIDRDYATWFEFAWGIDGATFDACRDMTFWNPSWFVANDVRGDMWNSEIAIPLDEILPQDLTGTGAKIDWLSQPWAISLNRLRPSMTTESLPAGTSDRLSNDQWLIIAP